MSQSDNLQSERVEADLTFEQDVNGDDSPSPLQQKTPATAVATEETPKAAPPVVERPPKEKEEIKKIGNFIVGKLAIRFLNFIDR